MSPSLAVPPRPPQSIFVLRNNDLGDLLIITPLFEALRRGFPHARILAGVGDWCGPILEHNPHVTAVQRVNAPWHNKHIADQSARAALRYIWSSPEVDALKAERCEIGLDVLGSPFGSLLMMRAGIPFRAGVKGYAGSAAGTQRHVRYNAGEHVGRSALRFAELLGVTDLPPNRPQLFLTSAESRAGESIWNESPLRLRSRKILVSPGTGFAEKRWPLDRFAALVARLADSETNQIIVSGSAGDAPACEQIAASHPRVRNLAGRADLRANFAVAAGADLVVCNASMFMHAAAAVGTPAVVLLGPWFGPGDQHFAQWGYSGLTHQLGGGGTLATVEDAAALAEQVLRTTHRTSAPRTPHLAP
jgi:heptosyltransferase-2